MGLLNGLRSLITLKSLRLILRFFRKPIYAPQTKLGFLDHGLDKFIIPNLIPKRVGQLY